MKLHPALPLSLLISVLFVGCKVEQIELTPSTIIFANGSAVTKTLGSGVYTNTVSGAGTGAVTYTSSKPAIATVNSLNGAVTLVAAGTTAITAKKASTDTHTSATNSYTLTVNPTGLDIPAPATNPTGWTAVWSDEFDDGIFGSNNGSMVWTREIMLNPPNNEWEQYTGDSGTAYEENGCMVLKASRIGTTDGDNQYTSARVISNPGGRLGTTASTAGKTFQYGRIIARIKLPSGKGIWPAFWMLGDNFKDTGGTKDWSACGEIDILESGSVNQPNFGQGTVTGALHHDPSVENNGNWDDNVVLDSGVYTLPNGELFNEAFHEFEIEWDASFITWRVDGVQFGKVSISEAARSEFDLPFYVLFNIAVGGWYTTNPDSSTVFPQYMYVDWIRYYKK